MFCVKCGTRNPDDAHYCHKCGQEIWRVADSTSNTRLTGKKILTPFKSSSANSSIETFVGVKGWLLFFCISLTILSPLFAFISVGMTWLSLTGEYLNLYPDLKRAMLFESLCIIGLTWFSIHAGIMLWKIDPRAITVTKKFLYAVLFYSAVSPIVFFIMADLPESAELYTVKDGAGVFLRGLIIFAIWNTYLNKSKRVRATYLMTETNQFCPDCEKIIKKESLKCEYCGSTLTPQYSVLKEKIKNAVITAYNNMYPAWFIIGGIIVFIAFGIYQLVPAKRNHVTSEAESRNENKSACDFNKLTEHAEWIVLNENKKGTVEFEKAADAYTVMRELCR